MASFNQWIGIGNLTRDPEQRSTPNGTAVTGFGMACNRKWRDRQSGEMREEVAFVDVEAWGKLAETCTQYLHKGKLVMVEGRLKTDQWEDKNTGQKRSKLKVTALNVQFLGARENKPAKPAPAQGGDVDFEGSEDIPF